MGLQGSTISGSSLPSGGLQPHEWRLQANLLNQIQQPNPQGSVHSAPFLTSSRLNALQNSMLIPGFHANSQQQQQQQQQQRMLLNLLPHTQHPFLAQGGIHLQQPLAAAAATVSQSEGGGSGNASSGNGSTSGNDNDNPDSIQEDQDSTSQPRSQS